MDRLATPSPRAEAPAPETRNAAPSAQGRAARPVDRAAEAALAVAAALGAWAASAAASPVVVRAVAAFAVGTAAYLLIRRLRASGALDRNAAAFAALFARAQAPAALSDAEGLVRAVNPAMAAEASAAERGGVAPSASISDLLARFTPSPEPTVYRLLRAVAERGEAQEPLAGDPARRSVRARAADPGAVVWTVETPADAAPAASASDAFIETLPIALARLSERGEILFANAAARALLGAEARPGARIGALIEGLGRSMDTRIAEALRGDSSGRPEIARSEPDGREVFLQVSLTLVEMEGARGLVAVFADATELKTLEAQFVQSQKMQAVGQLAGGVAHDFNNLLTAISGHTDLLIQRHGLDDSDYADLNQIRQNANRAAGLVRQLLAFSRKQTLRPRVVNLADSLTELSHLLNRLLGEKVSLRIQSAEDLHLVKVDERQFEQVVMNLVVNARDAMREGGEVLIRTANARIAAERRIGRAVMPRGDYVLIEVVDRGCGIAPDKLDQIFEPFYTTKRAGEGTGLGLSTVYGIVKQTGGFIFADSRLGEGTTFAIYLPRHLGPEPEAVRAPAPPAQQDLTGRGVVLLIEDEAPVRAFAARALKLRGYEVLEAASAEEALDLLEDPTLQVDVLVSDVVMPGMDGPTCVREARKMRPDVKVVFVSGYAEDALKRSMEGIDKCVFLPKPFSLNELTAKVKECASN
ncbi:MAG: ATP-binding protein [Rubrimonas sp.]|uniref:ATP-binding protein n=1 Tax=Rubrimonas sp. TaxID=2036015 RepID=UPI002FDCD3F5